MEVMTPAKAAAKCIKPPMTGVGPLIGKPVQDQITKIDESETKAVREKRYPAKPNAASKNEPPCGLKERSSGNFLGGRVNKAAIIVIKNASSLYPPFSLCIIGQAGLFEQQRYLTADDDKTPKNNETKYEVNLLGLLCKLINSFVNPRTENPTPALTVIRRFAGSGTFQAPTVSITAAALGMNGYAAIIGRNGSAKIGAMNMTIITAS